MLRKSVTLLLLLLSLHSFGQKKTREFVQKNVVAIKGTSPDSIGRTDFEAIGNAIGNARIVMLGEQTHGDGATMLVKSRLVKYLHEEKGFDVLAFEGDFFGLNSGWEQVQQGKDIKSFMLHNLHNVWSASAQCTTLLYSYLPNTYLTQRPLELSGFDNQVGYAYSNALLKDSIDQYLIRKGVPYIHSDGYRREFLSALPKFKGRFWVGSENKQWLEDFVLAADTVLAQLGTSAANDFNYLALESARSFALQSLVMDDKVASYNIRDAQMARNLRWLVETKYPNKKVIVWAANGHIMKNTDTAMKDKSESSINWMGTIFTKDKAMERQTYVLGFTSLRGSYRFATQKTGYPVQRPSKNGFETWIDNNLAFGFVDFRPFREENPEYVEMFMMKGHGPNNRMGTWTNIFDGVFYIRDMTPSDKIE